MTSGKNELKPLGVIAMTEITIGDDSSARTLLLGSQHRARSEQNTNELGSKLVFGSTMKNKSVMRDHSSLTTELAGKAFEIIGSSNFSVSANLDATKPESLRNFGLLESILLMAYNRGKAAANEQD